MLALTAGCLERKERITIHEDGSVDVVLRIAGQGRDIDEGPAAMPRDAVFSRTRRTAPRDHGDGNKHILKAEASFPSVAAMPTHHARPGSRAARTALRFESELRVRREEDRKVYVFVRRYQPRRWAPFAHLRKQHLPKELRKAVKDDLRDKPKKRRREAIEAFLAYERGKNGVWVEEAVAALPGLPATAAPEARLAATAALQRHFQTQVDPVKLADRLPDMSQAQLAQRAERIQRRAADVVVAAAAEALKVSRTARKRLRRSYEDAKRAFEVTQDLGDERFRVRLRMPGQVQRSNAAKNEDGALVWKFSGKALRDRAPTLIAVSATEVRETE